VSYPLVVDGLAYVVTNASQPMNAQLVALEAATGSTAWKVDLGPVRAGTIAYESGRVFEVDAASDAGAALFLRAYDAVSGALDWRVMADPNPGFFRCSTGGV
jgi:outer membrane protein assembly factor BamB